jgi:hypothetical protein
MQTLSDAMIRGSQRGRLCESQVRSSPINQTREQPSMPDHDPETLDPKPCSRRRLGETFALSTL